MSALSRYRQTSDVPAEIPVFPLRGAILLPRATMPLQIFEPRYLVMVDDAIRGDRLVGIIQPRTGTDESPAGKEIDLKQTGCVGRITSYQETDDDRLLITLTGVSRFNVAAELQGGGKPYRICRVDYAPFAGDLEKGRGEESVDRGHLLRVLKTYLETNQLKADWQLIHRAGNEFLVNTLSVISPYGAEEKQALLEAPDLKTRAEVLVALAEMEMASRSGNSGSSLQ